MGHMGRPGLSAAQKADLWHRWKQGQSLSEIGRALGKHVGSIHGVVSSNGGFIPPVRKRSRWALTLAEREEILRGLAADRSIRQIAATLGRAPSTVSREITRCGGAHTYRPAEADAQVCSCSAFFHSPTWVGCTPWSWAISFVVLNRSNRLKCYLGLERPTEMLAHTCKHHLLLFYSRLPS